MKYTNLTAFWWRTWINPADLQFGQKQLAAITVYDELSFTYRLTIDPSAKTATLTENHVIGRMCHLILWPWLTYYNSTGTHWLGFHNPNYTIYDFIDDNQIKMSIVNFQTTVLADRETFSRTATGQNVTDTETAITDTSIGTFTDDGEKVCDASFGTKKTYKLFNYTADPTETGYDVYDSNARTAKIAGYAGNAGLFAFHIGLMQLLPLVVVHMFPGLYLKAVATLTSMSKANYFYLIAYPNYSGYRVEHDPTLTVYLTTTTAGTTSPQEPTPNLGGIIVLSAIAAAIVVALVLVIRRRKPKQPPQTAPQTTLPPPPS